MIEESRQFPEKKEVRTYAEIGRFFGVRPESVKDWKRKGMPVEENGAYNLEKIARWRSGMRKFAPSIYPTANVEAFKRNRADTYAREQAEVIKIQQVIRKYHFTLGEIKDLDKKEAISLYDQLRRDQKDKYEQERLERGQSTANVASILKIVEQIKQKRKGKNEKEDTQVAQAGF